MSHAQSRQIIDRGTSGVLIAGHERFSLGVWRVVQKELVKDDLLPHVELKIGVEGSWHTHRIIQWYMHRPWYHIDTRIHLILRNHQACWHVEVEPWESKYFENDVPSYVGSAYHRFYVHEYTKLDKN